MFNILRYKSGFEGKMTGIGVCQNRRQILVDQIGQFLRCFTGGIQDPLDHASDPGRGKETDRKFHFPGNLFLLHFSADQMDGIAYIVFIDIVGQGVLACSSKTFL